MYTYQDLLKVGEDEIAKGEFCKKAIEDFRASAEYKSAQEGEAYYAKHNLTIEAFQKFLYTLSGRQIADLWSANYKLKTLFFRRLVSQQVQYVLGNGLTLSDMGNKDKLGRNFDFQLQTAAKKAMVGGRSFGFWNFDHVEVFGYADTPSEPGFYPLYDEITGDTIAGIRFWYKSIGNAMIFRSTLYEIDGYTEYSKKDEEAVQIIEPKRGYKRTTAATAAGGVELITDENYNRLPIVPLYANDTRESELVGIRECIDCYDLIKSGLANTIDDNADFYWVLKNSGGLDDEGLAEFVHKMKTVKAAVTTGDNVDVEAHTMEIPTDARRAMLEILRADIYEDFQALDVKTLSAAAKTTQEIQAAYQAQDNKCADFEYFIIDFVQQILELAGIDDNPTFVWNKVVNQQEQTQTILLAAEYLTDETIIKHLPFLTPEEADEIIAQRDAESMATFGGVDTKLADMLKIFADKGDEGVDMLKDYIAGKKAGTDLEDK